MIQLLTIVLVSMACVGTYNAIQEFIFTWDFENFDDLYQDSHWIWKPVFTCVTCMASIWGTAYYWIITLGLFLATSNALTISEDRFTSMLIFWPITCVSCAFLNTLLYKLVDR